MTIRTFWTILVKIIGIWLVFSSVTVIPQFISSLWFINSSGNSEQLLLTIGILVFTIILYLLILWLLVFNTEWFIDKLKLDQKFTEERIEISLQQDSIIQIAIIVIGGLMLVDALPVFCKQVFYFYQQKSIMFRESPNAEWIIYYFIKAVIGYLLMTNSLFVANYINRKSKEHTEENTSSDI